MTAVPKIPQNLVFESPRGFRVRRALVGFSIIAFYSLLALTKGGWGTVFLLLVQIPMAAYVIWMSWRQEAVTIDVKDRHFRFYLSDFGRPARKTADVSFGEIESVGLYKSRYGYRNQPLLKTKLGLLYAIPNSHTFNPRQAVSEQVVAQVVAATGLPRVDGP